MEKIISFGWFVGIIIVLTRVNLFTHSYLNHRISAHGQYILTKNMTYFWYVIAWLAQGSSYLSPYAYGMLHQLHHEHEDTEYDPHSPKYHPHTLRGLLKMMILTAQNYKRLTKGGDYVISSACRSVDANFCKPHIYQWKSFDRFADSRLSRLFWLVVWGIVYFFVLRSLCQGQLVYVQVCMILLSIPLYVSQMVCAPIDGAVINWFGHIWGERRHKMNNTSTNLPLPLSIFMLGEGFHNDHHHNPRQRNFGEKWYEIDLVYWGCRLFTFLGLHRVPKIEKVVKPA